MKDAIDQELKLGDVLIYVGRLTNKIRIGRIKRYNGLDAIDIIHNNSLVVSKYPAKDAVKIHDQYKMNFPEMFI